jgi:hypothetical protein
MLFRMLGTVSLIPVRVFEERGEHDLFQVSEEGVGVTTMSTRAHGIQMSSRYIYESTACGSVFVEFKPA